MTIRKPIDYLKKARRLTAQRRGGAIAPPAPSAPSRRIDVVRPETQAPAPELSGYRGTRKYAIITEPDALSDLVAVLEDVREVAFDVETYPLDDSNTALDPRRGRVRLISVAAEESIGGVVDVSKVHPDPLLKTLKNKTLIAHNGKFDLSFLKYGFGYKHDGPVVDTQVLDAVLYYADGPRERKSGWQGLAKEVRIRSLQAVAEDYLDAELSKDEQTSDFGREKLTEAQVRYALQDAEILVPLKEAMMRRVRDLGIERVTELEARFLPALAYCENNGFALDVEGWRQQATHAAEEAREAAAECDALAPPVPIGAAREGWNWGSTQQVSEALELLGTRLPKTEKGNPRTNDAALKAVASPENAARLAQALLRHREAKKKASTWGLGWFDPPKKKGKKFDKGHQFVVDGRVFTSFRQVVRTGRMSSSQPNLQNLPPESRRHFVAPPGRKLIVADYKNIELVLAGVVAEEERLLEAFRRGEDVHSMTARGMLKSDPKRGDRPVTDDEIKDFRPVAKLVSFSLLYGSTAKGLAEVMSNKVGVPTSKEKAQTLVSHFFEAYPKLKKWYLKELAKAKASKDRTRTLSGRLRLLDKEYRFGQWRVKPQLRLNTPIQGSAGDGFKYAVALLWEKRRECPGDPKVVNLVHDEIVVEIGEEHAEAGRSWLERCMIAGMAEVAGPDVPVSVEIVIADSWDVK
jgi:DNA polymerase I-like protein with 3'-5' exonuclease and polymerase domains